MQSQVSDELDKRRTQFRSVLVTEEGFRTAVTSILQRLNDEGLGIQASVFLNSDEIDSYGASSAFFVNSHTPAVTPLRCVINCYSSKGDTPQEIADARDVWQQISQPLGEIFEQHFGARDIVGVLWTGNDPAVQRKRKRTVANAVQNNQLVAVVRLDCDGFGAAQQLIQTGDEGGDAIIRNVANFIRKAQRENCLVFHPHGDEFEFVFVGLDAHVVLTYLQRFQSQFNREDFRPIDFDKPIHLGIRMAVAFCLPTQNEVDPKDVYDDLRKKVNQVDLKKPQRGFIEIAGGGFPVQGKISSEAIQGAVLVARRGLTSITTNFSGNVLCNYIAEQLIRDSSDMALTADFEVLCRRFVIQAYAGAEASYLGGPANPVSRWMHVCEIASLMLHVLWRRRMSSRGPLGEDDQVRVCLYPAEGHVKIAVERKVGEKWEELFSTTSPSITIDKTIEVLAGQPWLDESASVANGAVTKWVTPDASDQQLLPCLLVLAGPNAVILARRFKLWCAGIVKVDDRPVVAGHLPDFWQSNIARIINECLANPNVRTILLVRDDRDTVARTAEYLRGGCLNALPEWDDDTVSVLAAATTIAEPMLRRFRDRGIELRECEADQNIILKELLRSNNLDYAQLTSRGKPEVALRRDERLPDLQSIEHSFVVSDLKAAYPTILRLLRSSAVPRYGEPSELSGPIYAEMTGVRVEMQSAAILQLPDYWRNGQKEFDAYYERAFASADSLFGNRFYRWGTNGNGSTDQVERAVNAVVRARQDNVIGRKAMIVTAQPPGDAPSDPLGLVSLHCFPRYRKETWYLDFIWVWRSVESIVGFPFSAYGSIRFSQEFLVSANRMLQEKGGPNQPFKLGSVTYIALSLHLFCDNADLAIARKVDLDATP